ncbi:MAG TPA: acetylornithine/succinylornithine family transaminase [Symbiobacteriaceae bacterium]|nr:acetylornithine/succinylornithine family transaminase [Symbiobacteriaceae bacterium]
MTKNLLETERRYDAGVYEKHDLVLTRGEGARVWDVEGREYIDCVGGYGVANVGHSNPMVVRAVQEQAARLMVCAQSFPNDRRAELLEELVSVLPQGLGRVWLCNSGTEAMEAAIKFARTATGRHKFVAMRKGFSGRSMGALSLTWEPKYREPFYPLLHETTFVDYNDLAGLEQAVDGETAAVILEPVQGEGGVHPGTAAFLRKARELTRMHGALLVLDEIQTGFCRTGAFFALEHAGVTPDLMTLAKGMGGGVPVGALAMTDAVANAMPKGGHGTTFGGNPLAMAAATAAIRFMKQERLWERAKTLGAYFQESLGAIHAPQVTGVRGLGLMVGLQLDRPSAPYIQALEHEHNILALQAGPNVIRYLPPLVISQDDLARVAEATAKVLRTVQA